MQEIVELLKNGVIVGDKEGVKKLVEEALKSGMSARDVLDALTNGMNEIGRRFEDGEIFLPEVMLAADAMYAGLEILEPELLKGGETSKLGKVVIGTVEGDIHDIGKNIVKIMLQGAGFEVYDLGKDVPCENFVEKAKEVKANIIGVSALMSTTTPGQKRVAEIAKEEGLKVEIMVGGACTTREWAESIGAHYAPNATEAVKIARSLVSRR
jgi:dimethylamine corrinoid protein